MRLITIIGLGIFTLSFFAAHTMASRMVALHAKQGKSSATSIYWLFYYFGSSVYEAGQGIFCTLSRGLYLSAYWHSPY